MRYQSTIAEIYDSIFFLIYHFEKEDIFTEFSCFQESPHMFELLEEISHNISTPPSVLAPFFNRKAGSSSSLSKFFHHNIDPARETMETFTEKIRSRSDALYRITFAGIFNIPPYSACHQNCPPSSSGEFLAAMEEYNDSADHKLQLALLAGNYSYAIEALIKALKIVHAEVQKLHAAHADEIALAFERINAEESLPLYETYLKFNKEKADSTIITIPLLNSFVIYCPPKAKSSFMMLGLHHEQYFSNTYSHPKDLRNFMVACGSELRMKMLEALTEKKEMTLSEFAKYVGAPPSTVIRNLKILHKEKILCISKKDAQQIFYTANIDLLKQAKNDLDRLINNLIK